MSQLFSKIAGIGFYVPERIVTNDDLAKLMDTNDAWIQERTGIKQRRYAKKHEETTTTMGARAAEVAIKRAGITAEDVEFIVFATLSPDYYFPGCGVLLQRELKMKNIGALDIRNQCSGFVYALSIADQFVKTGMYKNVLVVGSEFHSSGLDFTDAGRNVSVIFGDGAGAVVVQPSTDENKRILSTHLHSDGTYAEKLAYINPGCHGAHYLQELADEYIGEPEFGGMFLTQAMIDKRNVFPNMDGQLVFKNAVVRFPEVIAEALAANNLTSADIDMLVPHQANLRISEFVRAKMGLPEEKVYNNIQYYGNTTAASIPIALCEAWEKGLVKEGDLVCLAAFGAGFTWASALIRW
jgi:3-oxoacyl-[acyl-carrier-protein] synthase-3